MFVGRERELASLNHLYASDKFEFAVIYGRRRVGKTALINQFIKDKKVANLYVLIVIIRQLDGILIRSLKC